MHQVPAIPNELLMGAWFLTTMGTFFVFMIADALGLLSEDWVGQIKAKFEKN